MADRKAAAAASERDYVSDRVIWKFGPESGDTARTPADAAETQRSEAVPDAVSLAGEGASSPGRVMETALAQIDVAASVAHDFIYGKNGVTQEQASRAIWIIHDVVNSFADAADEADALPDPMLVEGESVWNIH